MYVGVGASQNAFNQSTSRLILSVTGVTMLLAMAAGAWGHMDGIQTLAWGGNVVYLGALAGWRVADGIRE